MCLVLSPFVECDHSCVLFFVPAVELRVQRQPVGDCAAPRRPQRPQGLAQDSRKRARLHRGEGEIRKIPPVTASPGEQTDAPFGRYQRKTLLRFLQGAIFELPFSCWCFFKLFSWSRPSKKIVRMLTPIEVLFEDGIFSRVFTQQPRARLVFDNDAVGALSTEQVFLGMASFGLSALTPESTPVGSNLSAFGCWLPCPVYAFRCIVSLGCRMA